MARCYLYKIACVAVCVAVCCGMARCYLYSAEKDLKGAEDARILLESVTHDDAASHAAPHSMILLESLSHTIMHLSHLSHDLHVLGHITFISCPLWYSCCEGGGKGGGGQIHMLCAVWE